MESPVQVDDLVADAEEWFSLSDLYDKGIGVAENRDESMRLLVLAADDLAADAEVQFKLACALHFRAIEAFKGFVHREDGDKRTFLMKCDRVEELQDHADFVEAARRYKLAADQGHLRALLSLSDMYDKGIGVAMSRDESMRLLALAADDLAADAEVQFKLACALHFRAIEALEGTRVFSEDGDTKTRTTFFVKYDRVEELQDHADFVEAARRFKLAADQGHLRALLSLSDMYDKGMGVAKSRDESMRLLALAAEQKQLNKELDPMAKFLLSQMYSNGWHVKIDQIEALRLMKLAAEENCPFPLYYLATLYDGATAYDIGIWNGLEGIKEDLNEAVRLYKLAIIHSTGKEFFTSNTGDKRYYVLSDSQYRLALLLKDGKRGVQPDWPEAARLFKLAGEAGISSASFHLALMHQKGQGVPKNFEEAARLYKLAADQGDINVGNVSAHGMLGSLYASGQGVHQDHVESVRLFKIAAKMGDVRAQIGLGDAYEKGQGVCQDFAEAARWYCTAAEQIMPMPQGQIIMGSPSNPVARAKLAALQLKMAESQFVASVSVAPISPACDLVIGTRVRIEGLQSTPEMNGRMGVISGAFNEQSGRYMVDMEKGIPAAQRKISIRPANIHPIPMEAGPLNVNCLIKKGRFQGRFQGLFPLVFRGDRLFSALWGNLNPNALAVAQGARVQIQTGLNPTRSFIVEGPASAAKVLDCILKTERGEAFDTKYIEGSTDDDAEGCSKCPRQGFCGLRLVAAAVQHGATAVYEVLWSGLFCHSGVSGTCSLVFGQGNPKLQDHKFFTPEKGHPECPPAGLMGEGWDPDCPPEGLMGGGCPMQ